MAKIEEVSEEADESSPSSFSTSTCQVPIIPSPIDKIKEVPDEALDSLTIDLYNALNGKSEAEKLNVDLRDQLSECHQQIKELTFFEENLKNQVFVNQLLCIERKQALAGLKAEKNFVLRWCDASLKVDKII